VLLLKILSIWNALHTVTATTAFVSVVTTSSLKLSKEGWENLTPRIAAVKSRSNNNKNKSQTALGSIVARNGLQYEDVEIGTGRRVLPGDAILCYYVGTLQQQQQQKQADGRTIMKTITFDETSPGEPIEVVVGKGQVIKGWDLAILGDRSLEIPPMKIGGDRKVLIPAALAYGNQQVGPIPANQDLEFQIMIINAQPTGGVSTETQIKGIAGLVSFLSIFALLGVVIAQNYNNWF
jgi:FKBP-type peptidyl-prolyl cis-trans isomerase